MLDKKKIHAYYIIALSSLFIILALGACGLQQGLIKKKQPSGKIAKGHPNKLLLLVSAGNNASSTDGIYSFKMIADRGQLEQTAVFPLKKPGQLLLDPTNNILYTLSRDQQASVMSFSVNTLSGELQLISSSPTLGKYPNALAFSGSKLLSTNSGDGTITLFEPTAAGQLGTPVWRINIGKEGSSRPSSSVFSARGNELLVADAALSKIFAFNSRNSTPPLTLLSDNILQINYGAAPIHLLYGKNDKYLYILCEQTAEILVARKKGGQFQLQSTAIVGEAGIRPTHMLLSEDGRTLFCAFSGKKSGVNVYSVNPSTAELQYLSTIQCSADPVYLALSSDEEFLAVASEQSYNVDIFERSTVEGNYQLKKKIALRARPQSLLWVESAQ